MFAQVNEVRSRGKWSRNKIYVYYLVTSTLGFSLVFGRAKLWKLFNDNIKSSDLSEVKDCKGC